MRAKRTSRKKRARTLRNNLIFGLVSISFIVIIAYLLISSQQSSNTNPPEAFSFKAAIVDHLSLTVPNQTFIDTATEIMQNANFTVTYYKGEEVTVEFYRNLPTHDYGLIIMRVHSAWEPRYQTISLFTSEPYSQWSYWNEQLDERVGAAAYQPYNEGDPLYFGITQKFVQLSMKGKFKNTIIIMMGCNGLETTTMAEAFIEKGAKAYISWDKLISAPHTDTATINLLQHLLIQKQTIEQAVNQTMTEIGPDPLYESALLYYPHEAGNYAISYAYNPTTSTTKIKEITKTKQHETN